MRRVLSNDVLYKDNLADFSRSQSLLYYENVNLSQINSQFDIYSFRSGSKHRITPDLTGQAMSNQDESEFPDF